MRSSSTLLAASTTGLPDRRRILTTASSASVMPTVASTTNSTASASAHRDLGLAGDPLGQAAGVGVPAPGVHDGEGAAVPVGVVGHPVAGHAGHVLDDRLAAAEDPVDQGGLADVGAADDREHGDRGPSGSAVGGGLGHVVASSSCGVSLAVPCGQRAGQLAPDGLGVGEGVEHVGPQRRHRVVDVIPCVRGHGCAGTCHGRRRRLHRRCALGRSGVAVLPGSRVPNRITGTTGAPVTSARYAAPRLEPLQLTGAAGALGEDADHAPVARARAGRSGWRPGRGRTGRRGSDRPGAGTRPCRPWNISRLVRACTGRGLWIASIGPSSQPTWLAARITGPVGGTRSGVVDADAVPPACVDAHDGRSASQQQPSAGGDGRRCAAARGGTRPGCAARSRASPRPSRPGRPPGRPPRPGCAPVLSMCDGAVGHAPAARWTRPESIRSRLSSDSWVAARSAAALLGGPPLGAGRRVGGQEDLDLRVRRDDGADVAALDDDARRRR